MKELPDVNSQTCVGMFQSNDVSTVFETEQFVLVLLFVVFKVDIWCMPLFRTKIGFLIHCLFCRFSYLFIAVLAKCELKSLACRPT